MTDILYNRGLDLTGDFESATYKALLVTGAYSPNPDHDFVSDVVAYELNASGTSYARATLGSKTRTLSDALNRITLDCADPDFGPISTGQSARYMIFYLEVTNDADSILIACLDMGGSIPTNGTSFIVNISSDGLYYSAQGASS